MGCVSSKQAVSVTPAALDYSGGCNVGSGRSRVESCGGAAAGLVAELDLNLSKVKKRGSCESGSEPSDSGRLSSNGGGSGSVSFRLGNMHKFLEREQVAAGWPAWLSAVAGEAIQGWVPLRADSFEKLEKIGQGTYSTVFRALDLETEQMVALKKVRFDNFEPESVRFMAREITILRRLDHPNIIKLLGLIASRSSCNIYLVFEYMEHDISGLLSSPDITFTEPQIKCYMKQLLSGLEHCHSHGVMHRDIKGANILVDNNGVLKVADFGLANYLSTRPHRHPLTSRVVTLWYRPPELLLGSTDYGVTVDLWSTGCLLAELLIGKPILQGRTEVEQLHKIFKLCGSPPEEYWKKTRLPHATLFKPNQPYKSTLWETFKDHDEAAVKLIQTLLSVEPHKRGTAASALSSEYFRRAPYACDPSSLPSYPPSKEINIKRYEETSRKKQGGRIHAPDARKPTRKQNGISKHAPEETSRLQKTKADNGRTVRDRVPSFQGDDGILSGHLQASTAGNNFAMATRRDPGLSSSSRNRSSSRSLNIVSSSSILPPHFNNYLDPNLTHNGNSDQAFERTKLSMVEQWRLLEDPGLNTASHLHSSNDLQPTVKQRYNHHDDETVEFSGPLISHHRGIDELLEKHERHIRRTVRRSWFHKARTGR